MLAKKLTKIGNASGIIIDKILLKQVEANEDSVFKITVHGNELRLTPLSEGEIRKFIKDTAKSVSKRQSTVLKKLAE